MYTPARLCDFMCSSLMCSEGNLQGIYRIDGTADIFAGYSKDVDGNCCIVDFDASRAFDPITLDIENMLNEQKEGNVLFLVDMDSGEYLEIILREDITESAWVTLVNSLRPGNKCVTLWALVETGSYDKIAAIYSPWVRIGSEKSYPIFSLTYPGTFKKDKPLKVSDEVLKDEYNVLKYWYPSDGCDDMSRYVDVEMFDGIIGMYNRKHIGYHGKVSHARCLAPIAALVQMTMEDGYKSNIDKFLSGSEDTYSYWKADGQPMQVSESTERESSAQSTNAREGFHMAKGEGSLPSVDALSKMAGM